MTEPAFDLNSPDVIADPYPHYAWLRENAPVHYSPDHDLWILSRRDDVIEAVRDHGRFSSDLGGLSFDADPFNPTVAAPPLLTRLLNRLPVIRVLLTSDPPHHTTLRRKVSRAFTPKKIAAWEPRIREVTERLVEEMASSDRPADLVRDLASPLPTTIIAELMGIPPRPRVLDRPRRVPPRPPQRQGPHRLRHRHPLLHRPHARPHREPHRHRDPGPPPAPPGPRLAPAGEPTRINSPVLRGLRAQPVQTKRSPEPAKIP